jgi:hypothetical protein
MKYLKESKIRKMPLDEVMTRVKEAGIELPKPHIFEVDPLYPDPLLDHYRYHSREQMIEHNAAPLDKLARMYLFHHGVVNYVKRIGRVELDKQLVEHKVELTHWEKRTFSRQQLEKALIRALSTEEEH